MPRETVSTLLVEGQRQLQLLKSMAGPPPRGRAHGQQEGGGVKGWLESGDPEEERGKVGQGWPWEQQQDHDDNDEQGGSKPR